MCDIGFMILGLHIYSLNNYEFFVISPLPHTSQPHTPIQFKMCDIGFMILGMHIYSHNIYDFFVISPLRHTSQLHTPTSQPH